MLREILNGFTFVEFLMVRKSKKHKSWSVPVAVFLSAALMLGIIRFISKPDHRYVIRGIDVSAHTGSISWEKLKDQRVYFAFVKASEGATLKDKNFQDNVNGARAAGIPVGAYHFFNFNRDGLTQANNFLSTIGRQKYNLPLVVDVEEWGNNIRRSRSQIIADLREFVSKVEKNRYQKIIIYTNEDCYKLYIQDVFPDNDIWICSFNHKPKLNREWTFWQYEHNGRLKGVKGKVDFNVFRGSMLEWRQYIEDGR